MSAPGIIGIVLMVALLVVLVYASTRPNTFRVERSVVIRASAERIFGHVNDFRGWTAWSPWEKKDPGMRRRHSGAEKGEGAVYEWDGNKEVGSGRMKAIEVTAPARIVIRLDFLRPFEAHNTAEFTFKAEGDATRVTWAMFGPALYVTKLMGLFLDMDAMVGRDFEAGLASLKALAEK